MRRLRFPIAVALTSLAIVAGLLLAGGFLVQVALAGAPGFAGFGGPPWAGKAVGGPPWAPGLGGGALPPQLAGLRDVPPAERFAHFKGARVALTDKDGQPVALEVTPGTVTAASPSSVTVAANDGTTKTFAIDGQTAVRRQPAPNDRVVVVTLNGAGTAAAVLASPADGLGPHGRHGWWGA
jgi:hypothetical protein